MAIVIHTADLSYLENLPYNLDVKQRMIYEAIGISASIVKLNLESIYTICSEVCKNREVIFSQQDRNEIFLRTWSIVDHIHNSLLLYAAAKEWIIFSAEPALLSEMQKSTKLRNYMDHLAENLSSNLPRKAKASPLLGVLTFLKAESDFQKWNLGDEFTFVTLSGSSGHKNFYVSVEENRRSLERDGMRYLCDHFVLFALDHYINLRKAALDCIDYGTRLSAFVEENCLKKSTIISGETGVSVKEILKPVSQPFIFTFKNKFTPPPA